MVKKINKVGIIGCGAILKRHAEAISLNKNFTLTSLCDTEHLTRKYSSKKYGVNTHEDYKKMITSNLRS